MKFGYKLASAAGGLYFALLFNSAAAVQKTHATGSLMGQRAPEWHLTNWVNSPPLKLQELRGNVVLVRWWTAPSCPYCAATAPALNEFDARFRERGLRVIGAYHEKDDGVAKTETVKRYAKRYGFTFPVAIDPEWRTLHEWWLDRGDHDFTSVTFLVDRQGIVRFIHPGGQYVKGDKGYAAIKAKIEELLDEK